MTVETMKAIERVYSNNGQHAEMVYRFTMTGLICKADNKPASEGGDYENVQIKSTKASICKGNDIIKAIAEDGATEWAYVESTFTKAYKMNADEWISFVTKFGYVTKESEKNGGKEKIRLKAESKKMIEWLEARA